MESIGIERDDGVLYIKNKHKNTRHPFYLLFEFRDTCDILKTKQYLDHFYSIIQPDQRWGMVNLTIDYFFAGLFKQQIKEHFGNSVNFPILLVTGQPRVGKTFIIENICEFFYHTREDYKLSQNNLDGASPMTRMQLRLNSTFPQMIDEVSSLKAFGSIINNYLTDGYLHDSINLNGKKILQRFNHHTLIFSSNAIKLEQYGSDAINERFVNYEFKIEPQSSIEISKKSIEFNTFKKSNPQIVGATILSQLQKYESELFTYLKEKLQTQEEKLQTLGNIREQNKLKFLLIGMYIREFLNTKTELKDAFKTNNDVDFYLSLIQNTASGLRVQTRHKHMELIVFELLTSSISIHGDKFYFGQIFENDEYKFFYNDENPELCDMKYPELMKQFYYLIHEFGVSPSTQPGVFIITKSFLQKISERLPDKTPIIKHDFADQFSKYIKTGHSNQLILGTAEYYDVQKDLKDSYTISKKITSNAIKFDLFKFMQDMRDE